MVQNDYPPQGLAAQSLPIPVRLPNVTQSKFNFISSITFNNYHCASAFRMILRITVIEYKLWEWEVRHVSTVGKKNLLSSNISSRCPHCMVNFGPLAAEIFSLVWGHPTKFQLVSRLGSVTARHVVVGVSQTLRR